jgi:hypothetical protein
MNQALYAHMNNKKKRKKKKEWPHNCYLGTQTLAILHKPQNKHGEGGPEKPLTNDKAPILTAPPSALPSKPPINSEPPNGYFPLQQTMVGRGRLYVPFQLSHLRQILKDLGSYTSRQYIQAFFFVIQTFKLACKDSMLLLHQTLSSLEKQWVLAQAT